MRESKVEKETKNIKTMDKNILPESWAIAIQKDIATILSTINEVKTTMATTMATKDDIRQIREEMATKEDLRNYATLSDVRTIVSDAKNEILKEMDHLRGRTIRLEEKIGILPAHA